jgi:hypothetical protein
VATSQVPRNLIEYIFNFGFFTMSCFMFDRFGPVQSVRLLGHEEGQEGSAVCAAVAFVDIKSAAKAHSVPDHRLDDRTLRTDYYEPGIGSRATTIGGSITGSIVNSNGPATTTLPPPDPPGTQFVAASLPHVPALPPRSNRYPQRSVHLHILLMYS